MKKIIIILSFLIISLNVNASNIEEMNFNKNIESNFLNIKSIDNYNNDEILNIINKDLKKNQKNITYNGKNKIKIYPYNKGYLVYVNLCNAKYKNDPTNINIIYKLDKNYKITSKEVEPFTELKDKFLNEKSKKVDNNTLNKIVILKVFNDNKVDKAALGAFISKDVVLTSAEFIKNSIYKNQDIIILKNNNVINIKGIISLNKEFCLLKLDTNNNEYFNISSINNNNYEQIKINNNLEIVKNEIKILNSNKDILITKSFINNYSYSSLMINNNDIVGISSNNINNSNYTVFYTLNNLINNDYINADFKSLEDIKKLYVINSSSSSKKLLDDPKIDEYKRIGNIDKIFGDNIIKESKLNNTVVFRIINRDISKEMKFINNLYESSYKNISSSDTKKVFNKNNTKIEILNIFGYSEIIISKGN